MDCRALVKNAVVAFVAQGVSFAASLVMSLLVPKVLGVEMYGYWQLFVFYASYSGFFHFGLNDGVYLLEGGKTRDEIDKRFVNSQFRVLVAMQAIVGVAILIIGATVIGQDNRAFVMAAFSIYTVILNTSAFLGYVFQAINETSLFSIMTVLERVVFLVPMFIMVILRVQQFEPYVIWYIISRACSLFFSCWRARDFIASGHLSIRDSLGAAVSSIRIGFSLMIANIAGMLIIGVTRAMVDAAWGIEVFGKVSLALSVINFFISFVSQGSMVLFPALRQGSETERRSFYCGIRDVMEVAFPFVYLLYFPVAWTLTMWLPQYASSMRYLAILLPICIFNSKMDICGTTFFKVLREERILLKVNLATVIISAMLSAIGVFILGSLDAALIGAVIAIIGRSIWSEIYLDRKLSVSRSRLLMEEVMLSICFIAFSLSLQAEVATLIFASVYVVYLVVNRGTVKSLLASVERLFQK